MAYFSKLKSTRWVPSRLRSLVAIERNCAATLASGQLLPDIKADDAAKAKDLFLEMQTLRFVKFMNFMIDYSMYCSI